MVSDTAENNPNLRWTGVLILVVMEDGLGQHLLGTTDMPSEVLILVLVEYGLGHNWISVEERLPDVS